MLKRNPSFFLSPFLGLCVKVLNDSLAIQTLLRGPLKIKTTNKPFQQCWLVCSVTGKKIGKTADKDICFNCN